MDNKFAFDKEQFNRIFPFFILLDKELIIKSTGKTLKKLYPGIEGKSFFLSFRITRPYNTDESLEYILSQRNQMVILEFKNSQQTQLRGQFELMEDSRNLLFIGSPWFESVEKVIENKLSLNDFAYHDPMMDLLHLLKTQEITTEDLKHLLNTVNKQKNDLKIAAKEIHEMSLFPTQNPDPLIRIDLDGNVLRQNPAADMLKTFRYEGIDYQPAAFWKVISKYLQKDKDRIIIEADSDEDIYSFVIKPIPDSGYYNIYGRNVTEQKRNEIQLEILSSIASQNTHGVVIADSEGKIEWANNSFMKMTGYTPEEMIGKKPGHLLQGPDSDPNTIAYLAGQIALGEPFGCEILNYNKYKKPYWLRIQGQALRDKKGNITKYFAIEEDITKEKENQKRIKEFEKRFRMAFEKIGDYVWEHNFTTHQTRLSQKDNHLLGITTDNIENAGEFWLNHVLEEDRHLILNNYSDYESGKRDSHALEYRIKSNDGNIKWVLDRGVVIEKDVFGNPVLSVGTFSDITRHKTLELDLSATASRLSSLIQNLYSGVLLENENRRIGLINQKFCDLFNIPISPEILVGNDCSEAAEQSKNLFKDPDEFVERIREILVEKKLVINEHLEMSDGKHLQRDYIPIWNNGKYNGHLWLYTDITDKINADIKLETQKKFYEQILSSSPIEIAVFDPDYRYLYLNPGSVRNTELREWLIGRKDEDYLLMKNADPAPFQKRRAQLIKAAETKKLISFEESFATSDGGQKYFLRNVHPITNDQGDLELLVGYGMDITSLKEVQHLSEENQKRYKDVIENSLAIITTHDLKGRFLSANPMVSKTYGYEENEVLGHNITEFMPEADRKLFNKKYLELIKTEKQASGIFRIIRKDGKLLYTLYNNFLKEEPGREPYIIAFAVDITERIEAERELKVAKKTTEELAQAKQNFLANMSHEIRTPMNAILGMSNQLTKTDLSGQQKFYLDTINTAAENLLVIINDILDLSKIEAGKLSIEEIAFEPKKIIENAMQVMMHKAEEKGIRLTNSFCDSRISDVLVGDPYRINQILLNLISNAIKFTEKGSVDIQCEITDDNEDCQVLCGKVIDTGIGMDTNFLKNPFQKFNQEDASISRRFGGTGLGMTITRSLVDLMGGTINISSKKNEGTTVSFQINLKKGNKSELITKESSRVDTGKLSGRKILVVDDNEMNRLVASAILQNYNVEIIEAENGAQAIDMVEKLKPEIVLMDIQMPVLNGFEATHELRKKGNNTPIIALTANAIKGENEKCIAAGMNDYISKPYKENELLFKLVKWLDDVKLDDENIVMPVVEHYPENEVLFDLRGLERIGGNNPEFINKMIRLFCDHTAVAVDEMVDAYEEGDYTRMSALAHKIKPSIANLKIKSIEEEVRIIELTGKEGVVNENTKRQLLKIKQTVQKVIERMKADYLNA